MTRFLLHRLILSLGVVLSFAMARLSGDLAISIAGANASEEDVAQAAAAIRRTWAGESPLYTGSWGSYSINDVSAILPVMFGGDDYVRDPELTQWIREGGSTSDADARRRAYSAAIRRITERALWMPLYNQVTNYAFNRRLSFTAQADQLPRLYLAKWS